MGETQVKGVNVGDGSVGRPDLNIATAGQAVITRILEVANSGIKINASSGIDSGTGDVKLALDFTTLDLRWLKIAAISDWAKAAVKPAYVWTEIGSKPTTVAGYGLPAYPTTLPANGGNADTVDSLHATNFFRMVTGATLAQVNDTSLIPGVYRVENQTLAGVSGLDQFNYVWNFGQYSGTGYAAQLSVPFQNGVNQGAFLRVAVGATYGGWSKIWTDLNDGSLSGLDADLLDGQHGSYYSAVGHTHSYQPILVNPVTGTGTRTAGYIPKFNADVNTLSDSPIYTDGTNVGIGTTALGYKLKVEGIVKVTGGIFCDDVIHTPTLYLKHGVVDSFVTQAGKGTIQTAPDQYKFWVAGVGADMGTPFSISTTSLSAERHYLLPDAHGTFALTTDIPTRAYPRVVGGGDLNFNWSGQAGQPTWLWGGNDPSAINVYNPSNFNVSNALTTSQRTFGNVRTDGINRGGFGSISISGALAGYAGIDFTDKAVTLMIDPAGATGFYKNDSTWIWYVGPTGTLVVGDVPWTLVTKTAQNVVDAIGTYYVQNATHATNADTLLSTRTNYKGITDGTVVGQLMWKNYGNNHTIFDASNSTSPTGNAVNAVNAAQNWQASFPTLMGWNGDSTYGVRVDSCRISDNSSLLGGNAAGYYTPMTTFRTAKPAINTVRANLGDPTVEEMALFHGQFTNKMRFLPANIQEESSDGVNWVASNRATANQLADIMLGEGQTGGIQIIPITAIGQNGYYRLTWNATGYCSLQSFYCYTTTAGNNVNVKIEKYNTADGWTPVANGNYSNWPGHTILPHDGIWFLNGATALPHHGKVRVTFSIVNAGLANSLNLDAIEWFGGYPAGRRNVEYYDRDKNVYFPNAISGTAINGTSVKVNGSSVWHDGNSGQPTTDWSTRTLYVRQGIRADSTALNLHLDAYGGNATYINYYAGTGGVRFCNGANVTTANITAAGIGVFKSLEVGQVTNGTAIINAHDTFAYYGCNTEANGMKIGPTGAATFSNHVDAVGHVQAGDYVGAPGGLSLYGTGNSSPTYGINFIPTGTANYGTHGGVTSDYAMYFNMDATANRGWIFRKAGTNVASINNSGSATFNGTVTAPYGQFNAQVDTTYGLQALGVTGGARKIFLAGQSGFSNGFTVSYDGTNMIYGFLNGNATFSGHVTVGGNYRQEITHGENHGLVLSAGENGAGNGAVGLYTWISEPGVTWTGAGIARNMLNSGTGFPRVNVGINGQMIHFQEAGSINFITENTAGIRSNELILGGNSAIFGGNVSAGIVTSTGFCTNSTDSAVILRSYNTSASSAEQFKIFHVGGEVHIRNLRNDLWLDNSISVTGNITTVMGRPVAISNGSITLKGDMGGYAMNYGFLGSSNTALGGFGIYGSGDTLGYFYIGTYGTSNVRVYSTGALIADGSGTFTGGGFNSRRGIKNIHPDWTGNALEVISKFQIRDFNYKNMPDTDRTLGFIVDEIPEEIGDYVLSGATRNAVNTYTLHGLSFKAHQETKTELELQAERIIVLENRVIELEGRAN